MTMLYPVQPLYFLLCFSQLCTMDVMYDRRHQVDRCSRCVFQTPFEVLQISGICDVHFELLMKIEYSYELKHFTLTNAFLVILEVIT